MIFETYYEENIENIQGTKRKEALTILYGLVKDGKLEEIDAFAKEDNRAYESAIQMFAAAKYEEWIDIIKNNQGEQEKKLYIESLPEYIYFDLSWSLARIGMLRDAGIAERKFEKSVGKSPSEVLNDLTNNWEKYNAYKQKDAADVINPKDALRNALNDGITTMDVIDTHQQQNENEKREEAEYNGGQI